MNRPLATLALSLAALALVACGPSDGGTTASTGAEDATGVTYESMEMGANETAALEHMPDVVAEYIESAENAGKSSGTLGGEGYLDVTGLTPAFVGYEIIAWTPIEGSEDVEYIELYYMNGHIVDTLASPETAITAEDELDVSTFHAMNTRPVPASPSAGEAAAVAAAEAEVSARFPDDAPEYGVKRYLFLYETDGNGVVLGTTLDGDLAVYGSPVPLS